MGSPDLAGVYSIPAGVPFAPALAGALVRETAGDHLQLAQMTIFLPTHRARQALHDAFLAYTRHPAYGAGALLLPRMYVIGAYDEDDLSLLIAGREGAQAYVACPPAIDPLYRQGLLARLIQQMPGRTDTVGQAMQLAGALAGLMDQIYTQGLSLRDLQALVPQDYADHWQITLEFLKVLSETWPQILTAHGQIDPAARRDRMIRRLTAHWRLHPPAQRVIVAGSTGSIPATAEFLSCVAHLPAGQIVLPGFDCGMPDADWVALPDSHPQARFRDLLKTMQWAVQDVRTWPTEGAVYDADRCGARRDLAREIMSPHHGHLSWRRDFSEAGRVDSFRSALSGVHLLEAAEEEEEAHLIAFKLRECLEVPSRRAVVVTPNRNLARRISAVCLRWDIVIEDAAGQPLAKTEAAVFMRLVAAWMADPFDPVAVLALVKHPLCMCVCTPSEKVRLVAALEVFIFRSDRVVNIRRYFEDDLFESAGADRFGTLGMRFLRYVKLHGLGSPEGQSKDIQSFLADHLRACSFLMAGVFSQDALALCGDVPSLFRDRASKILQNTLDRFSKLNDQFLNIDFLEYNDLFTIAIDSAVVRSTYGVHPRLQILGQMEARIMEADLVIMAGLNEGVWPAIQSGDPWMSDDMRRRFGLPVHDQALSLAAHDFVQAFCMGDVVMTRSTRIEGALSVASRWLQKLDVIAEVADLDMGCVRDRQCFFWLRGMYESSRVIQIPRPAPAPVFAARPRVFSVTGLERLLQDPYSAYAKQVLRLQPLPKLVEDRRASVKGQILHKVLELYVAEYGGAMRGVSIDGAVQHMMGILAHIFPAYCDDAFLQALWWPQFEDALRGAAVREGEWCARAEVGALEVAGSVMCDVDGVRYSLTGRADRVDVLREVGAHEGERGYAIIDYKTGGTYTKKAIETCAAPQLLVGAWIAAEGGFEGLPAAPVDYAGYWLVKAGVAAGQVTAIEGGLDVYIDALQQKFVDLMAYYADPSHGYVCLPNPLYVPRYGAYHHLARTQEWSRHHDASGEGGGDEG